MEIISRYDALTLGLTRYFSGVPCSRGHISERYSRNSQCLECLNRKRTIIRSSFETFRAARNAAIARGDVRYSPGVPCKHGHISQRYTSTNGCVDCLIPKFNSVAKSSRQKRVNAKLKMDRYKVGIHNEDLDYFTTLVHAFGALREPALLREDVLTKLVPQPRGGTMFMHAFKAFREDIPALRAIMQDLNWGRMPPETQARVIANQSARSDGWVPPPLR